VRFGVFTWIPLYFYLETGDIGSVGLKVALIPLAGVVGTLVYTKFPWKKDFTSMIFLVLMAITWFIFPYTDGWTATILLLASSAFLYGPHVFLVCTVPSRFEKKGVVASSTGFINGMGYVGTFMVGLIVPFLVMDAGGWSNVFLFWAVLSIAAAVVVGITYFGHFRKNGNNEEAKVTA